MNKKVFLIIGLMVCSNMVFGFRLVLLNSDDFGLGIRSESLGSRTPNRTEGIFRGISAAFYANSEGGIGGNFGMFERGVWGWASRRVCVVAAAIIGSYKAYQSYCASKSVNLDEDTESGKEEPARAE